ncbi:hypothetical protein PHLGIDRAFT_18275 [Phlebiopsis gigantea 11061_1 CR5-6]|uniref:Fms interacting protein n=1 Tax=Phlebiopsis gigantea (strain 11061_1 CR5-6) TaxID=745531 RepID=A0A0C3NYU5_PHLG1|nr:hypothetical protein PHLGIDRAFT_18275 [Phlebiopsis gigantea 11061_1 CR5-6]
MPLVDTTNAANPAQAYSSSPDAVVDSLKDLVSSAYLNHDASSVQIRAGALFARLKALNRAANAAARTHKQATAETRHDMDQTHLELQNLLYERRHLQREIVKCKQYASIYQEVPIYTLEEFVERAPEEMRTDDEHTLMANRINFELIERQRLEQELKRLTTLKEEMLKEGKVRLVTIEKLKGQVDEFLKHTTEVQTKVADLINPLTSGTSVTPTP